jgi:hypothetical protein
VCVCVLRMWHASLQPVAPPAANSVAVAAAAAAAAAGAAMTSGWVFLV